MPDSSDHLVRAFHQAEAGDFQGAIQTYRDALAARPDDDESAAFLGQLLMLTGDYPRGLPLHERRPLRETSLPLWRGEPIAGKTVLVLGEQGFGDNIQFSRYCTLVARRGARVVLGCLPGLGRLLGTIPGVGMTVEPNQALPPPDRAVHLMSLPYLLRTQVSTIPNQVPYIQADPERVAHWRRRLAPYPGLKVGLVWAGNAQPIYDYRRSPGLDPYLQLLDLPGISFFSLQKGDGAQAIAQGAPAGLTDLGREVDSFDDTAAIMENLDLVISSCTSPAHLAGALGRPLWVVLAAFPDWRWMLERSDNPWYPTARLFRRRREAGWDEVLGRVRQALAELAATPP